MFAAKGNTEALAARRSPTHSKVASGAPADSLAGTPGSSGRRQEIVVECKERQFQAIPNTQLIEDVRQVTLDGLFADAEGGGNVLVCAALGDESDDFQLTAGEPVGFARRRGRLRSQFAQHLYEILDRASFQPVLSLHDRLDAGREVFGGRVLQHDAPSSEL